MGKKQTSHRGERDSAFFKGTLKQDGSSMFFELQVLWDMLLRTVVAVTLISRGYLILRWGSHLRGVFWDEALMSPIVENWFGATWQGYVENSDSFLTLGMQVLGGVLIFMGLLICMLNRKHHVLLSSALVLSAIILALDSWSNFRDVHGQLGMLVEHALQFLCPLLLILRLLAPDSMRLWGLVACALCFFCFAGHGLYAVGYHPVPAGFVNMTMAILPLNESAALDFLRLAGWLDFAVAVAVLVIPPLRRLGLLYMIAWGFITALARPVVYCDAAIDWYGLDRWGAEFFVRTSHYVVPFLILLLLPRRGSNGRLNLQLMKLGSVTQRIVARI